MRTVPLHGKKAAGRVALVDDRDYEIVSQYRWRVYEQQDQRRHRGPYAITTLWDGSRYRNINMHCLIMGTKGIDHRDHDGLNNQRSNLRPANQSQNNRNQRPQVGRSSRYKGVFWHKKTSLWWAVIRYDGQQQRLGSFMSELQAAYAYDAAAREHFGEFAYPNFDDVPTQAMRHQWEGERAARDAAIAAETSRKISVRNRERMAQLEKAATCRECGKEYVHKSLRQSFYCPECRPTVKARYCREWRAARAAAQEGDRLS